MAPVVWRWFSGGHVRSRRRRSRNLKDWNFWSIVNGTIYGVRTFHPVTGRLVYGYGGKTIQEPWTRRIKQHLWDDEYFNSRAKPWADLVPGWRSDGTVGEVIAAGGAFPLWQGRTVPLILTCLEILFAIRLRFPLYNDKHNHGNPRRIAMSTAIEQRADRDARRRLEGLAEPPRARAQRVAFVLFVCFLLVLSLGLALL